MEVLTAWLNDGERNAACLYIDDETTTSVKLCHGADSFAVITLAPPFFVTTFEGGSNSAWAALCASCTRDEAPFHQMEALLEAFAAAATGQGEDGDDDEDFEFADAGGDDYDEEPEKDEVLDVTVPKTKPRSLLNAMDFNCTSLPPAAVERLLRDLHAVQTCQKVGWDAKPKGSVLNLWEVELFDFEAGSDLAKDMAQVKATRGYGHIAMEFSFPAEYPFRPPFVRVLRPRFAFRTGRVTVGGSICTEALTTDGWKPIIDVEFLIVSLRAQILDPMAGARIDFSNKADYTLEEAREAFARVAAHHKAHGW